MHCEMVTTINLINISITSKLLLGCVMRTLRSTLSKFQIENALLLTIVTMMCIRSPELTHLRTESLYSLASSPWPLASAPSDHSSVLCFCKCDVFRCPYKWDHDLSLCVWIVSLIRMPSRLIHIVAHGSISFFVKAG